MIKNLQIFIKELRAQIKITKMLESPKQIGFASVVIKISKTIKGKLGNMLFGTLCQLRQVTQNTIINKIKNHYQHLSVDIFILYILLNNFFLLYI